MIITLRSAGETYHISSYVHAYKKISRHARKKKKNTNWDKIDVEVNIKKLYYVYIHSYKTKRMPIRIRISVCVWRLFSPLCLMHNQFTKYNALSKTILC